MAQLSASSHARPHRPGAPRRAPRPPRRGPALESTWTAPALPEPPAPAATPDDAAFDVSLPRPSRLPWLFALVSVSAMAGYVALSRPAAAEPADEVRPTPTSARAGAGTAGESAGEAAWAPAADGQASPGEAAQGQPAGHAASQAHTGAPVPADVAPGGGHAWADTALADAPRGDEAPADGSRAADEAGAGGAAARGSGAGDAPHAAGEAVDDGAAAPHAGAPALQKASAAGGAFVVTTSGAGPEAGTSDVVAGADEPAGRGDCACPVVKAPAMALTLRPPSAAAKQAAERLFATGRRALDAGKATAALSRFKKAVARSPKSPDAWFGLALARTDLKQGALARTAAERALKLDPQHAGATLLLGFLAQQKKDLDTSKKLYARYLELEPQGEYVAEVQSVIAQLP